LAVHDSLYFGTAIPDGIVSAADWAKFLESTVTPLFPRGLTSSCASGQWRSADGEIVREDSHVLQLLHPDDAASEQGIRELIERYKSRFRQEAVLRITTQYVRVVLSRALVQVVPIVQSLRFVQEVIGLGLKTGLHGTRLGER
jgi:hypothetical protein